MATDLVEAVLFVNSKGVKQVADALLNQMNLRLAHSWVESGVRLALIGPVIYAIKLVALNIFLHSKDVGIEPISWLKVLGACSISFALSFSWGVLFDLDLATMANRVIRRIKARGVWPWGVALPGSIRSIE